MNTYRILFSRSVPIFQPGTQDITGLDRRKARRTIEAKTWAQARRTLKNAALRGYPAETRINIIAVWLNNVRIDDLAEYDSIADREDADYAKT